jgi:pimeloyl-ACP methyl ester carboxylesterase
MPNHHFHDHKNAGRMFEAGGLQSFVREEGDGPPVVCLHGVPSSSYLYRKVLAELAARGFRGIAFDFPGLGFTERPEDFDYSFTGLGKWVGQAADALGLTKYHLIIHDLGGPAGFEHIAARSENILSLTVLNTFLSETAVFKKPWVMRPFESPFWGKLYLGAMNKFAFTQLMYLQGVNNKALFPPEEAEVYLDILRLKDNSRAFLKIMRSFENTEEKRDLYVNAVKNLTVPVQFVWGEDDPALPIDPHGIRSAEVTGRPLHRLPSKHFLQEDQAPAIVDLFVKMVSP